MKPEEKFLDNIRKIAHWTHDGQTATKLYEAIRMYEDAIKETTK